MRAAVAKSPMGVLQGYNAVIAIDEAAHHFVGTKTGLARIEGALRLDGADEMDDLENIDAVVSLDTGIVGLRAEGAYAFYDP